MVTDKPYKKNGQSAPQFVMKESKDFKQEKSRLLNYLQKLNNLESLTMMKKNLIPLAH